MDFIIGKSPRKFFLILLGLLICTASSGFAEAQTQSTRLTEGSFASTLNHPINLVKAATEAKKIQTVITKESPLSDEALAGINGKGVPINLPSMSHQSSTDVVLWDELQTRGGGKNNIQMGGLNNMQSISMAANR
jgi:hypothetical protein